MTPLIPIAAFLKIRVKALKNMRWDDLLAWLAWHDLRKSLAWVDYNGEILAAGVARPLCDSKNRVDYYAFHEGADIVYADHAASESPEAFANLIWDMNKRFPYGKTFMFKHCKTGKVRSWNMHRFLHVTLKKGLSHG